MAKDRTVSPSSSSETRNNEKSAESLILVPVVIDANRLEVEDGPGTRFGPAHTGLLRTASIIALLVSVSTL